MENLNSIVTGKKLEFKYIRFEQPAGEMYLGVMLAADINQISKVNRLSDKFDSYANESDRFTQRNVKKSRIKEISEYAEQSNAIFPTPIILSGNSKDVEINNGVISFNESAKKSFSIIDGQHRLLGIMQSDSRDSLLLPCVIMFDTEPYEDALIFITINGKQVRVPSSIIYELFDIAPGRSVEKTVHNLAKSFNNDKKSPFENSIKMLGYKMSNQDYAPITQSSFATPLKDLIEKNKLMKRLFDNERDDVIYKILSNFFTATKNVFKNDWENPNSLLQKSIGFKALITLLDKILLERAESSGDFSRTFFEKNLKKISDNITTPITSKDYGSSYGGAKHLFDDFEKALNQSEK